VKLQFAIAFLLTIGLLSCTKEDPSAIDFGYDYFPNKVGNYVIFNVDSIAYNGNETVFNHQIKEVITDLFVDDTGEPAARVECFRRNFNAQPWILQSVCVQKRGQTNAERVVNNKRVILLEFPIKEGETWNGNAYNNDGSLLFKYTKVAQPIDIGIQEFDKTVTVQQENVNNLIEQKISKEVYAWNVGSIYRYSKRTNTQSNVTTGYEVEYAAIAYGVE
jgi:hypothetical protein